MLPRMARPTTDPTGIVGVSDLDPVVDAIRSARTVLVAAHTRPDGDAVGSTLALVHALDALGVDAKPVLVDEDDAPLLYRFLPGIDRYVRFNEVSGPADLLIALDTPNTHRLGGAADLIDQVDRVAVIDHHPDAKEFGDVHLFRTDASATAQIVWELIAALGITPTGDIATCCYTALMTDTGRFQFQNTTEKTFFDAAAMVAAGADPARIATEVYQNETHASYALKARVLGRLTIANRGAVSYSWIDQDDMDETAATFDDLEGLPDLVRAMQGVQVGMFLKVQDDGRTRVNLRSKGAFDVGAVARIFGGGGHAGAAGCTVDLPLEDAIRFLLAELPSGSNGG